MCRGVVEHRFAGRHVAETVRISLDAGSQLDHYQVTYRPLDGAGPLTAAVGLKKVAGEEKWLDAAAGTMTIWQPMEKNLGMQGLAVIVDPRAFVGPAEDARNNLVLVNAGADHAIGYWAGFAWDRAGRITSAAAWRTYVEDFAQGVRTPIEVTVSAQ